MSIALHVGPRFIIAICYKKYYEQMLCHVKNPVVHSKGSLYMNLAFWLHIVEVTSLCGVTYISNRENYSEYSNSFMFFCFYFLFLFLFRWILLPPSPFVIQCGSLYTSWFFGSLFFYSSARTSVYRVYGVLAMSYADRHKTVSITEERCRCTAITSFDPDWWGEIYQI